jgi:hypothetical protein
MRYTFYVIREVIIWGSVFRKYIGLNLELSFTRGKSYVRYISSETKAFPWVLNADRQNLFHIKMFTNLLSVYYPDQQMHNIHINNSLYIVSTPTYFDTTASSSGNLKLKRLRLPEDETVSVWLKEPVRTAQ